MTLDQSALLELTAALRSADGGTMMRTMLATMLQALIDKSQEMVNGQVRVKLYKGNATVIGRSSDQSLYDQDLVTFEEGSGSYDHRDAAGFIRLNALRLRTIAQRDRRLKA